VSRPGDELVLADALQAVGVGSVTVERSARRALADIGRVTSSSTRYLVVTPFTVWLRGCEGVVDDADGGPLTLMRSVILA